MRLQNYALGQWVEGSGTGSELVSAVTGEPIAIASSEGLDFKSMLQYARDMGGTALRAMTFHERAARLKAMAKYLTERKAGFYELSSHTGATKSDSWVDIDGGIGTLFVYASKGRRDFPNEPFYVDGPPDAISKEGTFIGRHLCVPLEGAAVQINAFNFPVWGMLEKVAPSFLAGMPSIVKPASITSYLTERVVHAMIESGIFPDGSLQLICGSAGDLLDHVDCQDVVGFTGSAATGQMLKNHPAIVKHSVRFNMEADSLNCSILGPDAAPGTDEFDLFVKEVVREMTIKAGQKCTAIRRTIVPDYAMDDVIAALKKRLSGVVVGDPRVDGVRMGPLAGRAQVKEVGKAVEGIKAGAQVVAGGNADFAVQGADRTKGAFFPITLLACNAPDATGAPHEIEAFGPVNTVMPYRDVDDAIELAKRGKGSLCGSLFSNDDAVAKRIVLGVAPYHGRFMVMNRHASKESTGHGSPMPHLVHGGPGRAGGGEEMGGVRGVLHFMQRTAVQGSPTTITAITNEWTTGAARPTDRIHPFRKYFDELIIGETLTTHRRTITEADVVAFAGISGDFFYAHMDDIAARASMFERRVAHGYFVIAAAAGLFVDPAPGPVLANYGMDGLRFVTPVYPGDTIQVKLTCKQKTVKETLQGIVPQGVVAWDVEVTNQKGEKCAIYTILTLVQRKSEPPPVVVASPSPQPVP